MNKLLYLLFLSAFLVDYFHAGLGLIPRIATWLPEIIAMLAFCIVALRFGLRKGLAIHPKYIYLTASYLLIIFLGIILNSTPPGPVFVGLRVYLKHLPFFFLPAVYNFSQEEFKRQLQFIFILLLLQCPIAFYQRLIQFRGHPSGDVVAGTVTGSGVLSIIMICSISVILALYLNKKINFKLFIITACCLFLPTTINETKVTLFLFPVAIFFPAIFRKGYGNIKKVKSLLILTLIGSFFIAGFIPIYDHFVRKDAPPILDFFQEGRHFESYLYKGTEDKTSGDIRRGDIVFLTYKRLSKEWEKVALGFGSGTLVESFLEGMRGETSEGLKYGSDALTLTYLAWELGLLGVVIYIGFFICFFKDSMLLRKRDDLFGSFALGWSSVIIIIGFSLIYVNIIGCNEINLTFWYFSGLVAAKAYRMKSLSKKRTTQLASIISLDRLQVGLQNKFSSIYTS